MQGVYGTALLLSVSCVLAAGSVHAQSVPATTGGKRIGGYSGRVPGRVVTPAPAPPAPSPATGTDHYVPPPTLGGYFPDSYQSWIRGSTMTGDWGGLRTHLENRGVHLQGHYLGEGSGNPVGGNYAAVRYAHEFGLGADIDFARLIHHDIGTLHILLTERAGLSLAAAPLGGAVDSVQQIFGSGETVRLTRLSLEKNFNRYVSMEAGWINTENDFGQSTQHWGMSIYCQFQTNAICGMPQGLAMNGGYGWYPTAHPGAWLKLYPAGNDHYLISAGIYNVDNTISNTHNGFKLGLNNTTGVYLPFQLGWHHGNDFTGEMEGNIRVGGYWDTSEVAIVSSRTGAYQPPGVALIDLPNNQIRGRFGGWVEADQMIQRDHSGSGRGTIIFGSFIWGDPRTALTPYFATWGIIRKGTLANRPNDTISFGGKMAVLNPKLGEYAATLQQAGQKALRPSNEPGIELNYGWRPTPWATLRPGLQYLWHPGGTNRYRNALIIDMETGLTF
ncbi:carbohydrate porin [Gluconacetobacter azotocaptans]|uniref:Carbohydrate porin n=1 Tax=Gluconacetobacter azotocaptans TaxID=142834 RepID=A0A7W4JW28_9PROT|nr:carbohydrate porin [Gluconacetobacter azotocaptans]